MLKTMRLISVAAAAALALPALAGSWPPIAPRKAPKAAAVSVTAPAARSLDGFEATGDEAGWQLASPAYAFASGKLVRTDTAPGAAVVVAKAAPTDAGFEYVGGETGWQPSQHKYVFAGGRFEMSDECDHAVRIVKAPTPDEVEATSKLYAGA